VFDLGVCTTVSVYSVETLSANDIALSSFYYEFYDDSFCFGNNVLLYLDCNSSIIYFSS
jgi:hypothetical protein